MTLVERRPWRNDGKPYVRRSDLPTGVDIDDPDLDEDAFRAAAAWWQLSAIALGRSSCMAGEVLAMSYSDVEGDLHAPFVALVRCDDGHEEVVIVLGNAPDYLSRDAVAEFERMETLGRRMREEQVEIDRIAALVTLTPKQRDAKFSAWREERLMVFGSGDLYVDLGCVHPRKIRFMHALSQQLAYFTGNGGEQPLEKLDLSVERMAEKAHVDVAVIEHILDGVVRDLEPWDLLRIMTDIGLDIYVDVLASDDERGSITT